MYNGEMVKRLERDALGTSFFHALQSPVSELVQHVHAWPSRCVLVLDGLYLSIPAFKASLQQFAPYAQRTYLMLHYLESMNTYYTAPAKAALWADEKLWLRAVQGIIVPSRQLREHLARQGIDQEKITVASPGIARVPADRLPQPEDTVCKRPDNADDCRHPVERQRPARCGPHASPDAGDAFSAPSDWGLCTERQLHRRDSCAHPALAPARECHCPWQYAATGAL